MKYRLGSPAGCTRILVLLFPLLALPALRLGAQTGNAVPNFALKDTRGQQHTLAQHAGKIVVLEFWSFKCPVSLGYRERMAALHDKYQTRDVVFLAIASSRNETPEEVGRNAENLKIPYPVLLDTGGEVAETLGAVHAPSLFILDRAGSLRYRGAVDNNRLPGKGGRIAFAEMAIEALLAGKPVPEPETRDFGCTIRKIRD
jgi:peroxiredoxin